MSGNFQLYAKNVFITFPRTEESGITNTNLLAHVSELCPNSTGIAVCMESHADGGQHFHVVLSLSLRKKIRDANYFDYRGRHGRIEPVKSLTNSIAYVKKDGDYISTYSEEVTIGRLSYADILRDSTNKEMFLSSLLEHHPRDAMMHWTQFNAFAEFKFSNFIYETPTCEFEISPNMSDWLDTEVIDEYPNSPYYEYNDNNIDSCGSSMFNTPPRTRCNTCLTCYKCIDCRLVDYYKNNKY
jgi:hypothetical protein